MDKSPLPRVIMFLFIAAAAIAVGYWLMSTFGDAGLRPERLSLTRIDSSENSILLDESETRAQQPRLAEALDRAIQRGSAELLGEDAVRARDHLASKGWAEDGVSVEYRGVFFDVAFSSNVPEP